MRDALFDRGSRSCIKTEERFFIYTAGKVPNKTFSAHCDAIRLVRKNAHTKNRTPRNVCFQAQLKPLSKVTGPMLRRKFAKRCVMFTTHGTDRVVFVWPKMLYALLRRVSVSVRQLVGWIVGAARSRTKTHWNVCNLNHPSFFCAHAGKGTSEFAHRVYITITSTTTRARANRFKHVEMPISRLALNGDEIVN